MWSSFLGCSIVSVHQLLWMIYQLHWEILRNGSFYTTVTVSLWRNNDSNISSGDNDLLHPTPLPLNLKHCFQAQITALTLDSFNGLFKVSLLSMFLDMNKEYFFAFPETVSQVLWGKKESLCNLFELLGI